MGEHDELQAIVGHVRREVAVDVHHALLEVLIRAPHGKGSAAYGIPVRKEARQVLLVPGEKEVRKLVVVDGICVGRIGDPEIGGIGDVARVEGEDGDIG